MINHQDITINSTATFLVDGDGEELTGQVKAIYNTNHIDINGFNEHLVDEDLPAALVDVKDTGVWLVPFAWITSVSKTRIQYQISVSFIADRPLTDDEQASIVTSVETQIIEPITWDHDDETLIGPIPMDVNISVIDSSIEPAKISRTKRTN